MRTSASAASSSTRASSTSARRQLLGRARALRPRRRRRGRGAAPAPARRPSPRAAAGPRTSSAARSRSSWSARCRSLFTPFSDVVSLSQSRRLAGFLPFAFALAGGIGVLARLARAGRPSRSRSPRGIVFQLLYPGDFGYTLEDGGPAWVTWFAVGRRRRRARVRVARTTPPLERTGRARVGARPAADLRPRPRELVAVGRAPRRARSRTGSCEAVRERTYPSGAIVYADPEASYRLGAFAPVRVCVNPPGHVADTDRQPSARARAGVPALRPHRGPLDPARLRRDVARRRSLPLRPRAEARPGLRGRPLAPLPPLTVPPRHGRGLRSARREGPDRQLLLPAGGRRRRAATAQARAVPPGARNRDPRARPRRPALGAPRRASCGCRRRPGCTARATWGRAAGSRPRCSKGKEGLERR